MTPEKLTLRVTWIGFIINVLLSAVKVSAGYFGHSRAMIADGIHSLSDCVTDIAVIIGSRYWFKPPDQEHHYGHRRVETFVTIFISVVLAGAAIGICFDAFEHLLNGRASRPAVINLAAALLSIITKEWLFRYTRNAGNAIKSEALKANAWHHRLDAFSSIPAFIAIGGAVLSPMLWFLDAVGAVVISFMILQAAMKILMPGLNELSETGAPVEICAKIQGIAMAVAKVMDVHKIRTRYVGFSLFVDLHIEVDGGMTVKEGHDISEEVKRKIIENGPNVIDVVVHLEAYSGEHQEDACDY